MCSDSSESGGGEVCQHSHPELWERSCGGLCPCPQQTVLQEAEESLSDLGIDQAQGCDREDPQNCLPSWPVSQLSEIPATEFSSQAESREVAQK